MTSKKTSKPRSRNADGRFRKKNSSVKVGSVEKKYGIDFGVRSDMKLSTLLEKHGQASMSRLLQMAENTGNGLNTNNEND